LPAAGHSDDRHFLMRLLAPLRSIGLGTVSRVGLLLPLLWHGGKIRARFQTDPRPAGSAN